MPKMPSTPSRASNPKRCDGLMFQLAARAGADEDLKLARRTVREVLAGRWTVRAIHAPSGLYEALRTTPARQPTVANALQMARELESDERVVMAEIAAIVPGIDPSPSQYLPKAQAEVVAKSSGGDKHKPCSKLDEWALDATNVKAAWLLTPQSGGKRFGEGIVVGHPDTGYTRHPEIFSDGRILVAQGFDFEDDDPHPLDPLKGKAPSHGTSTASVIMSLQGKQVANKPHFVSGVAPKAELIPLRVSTSVVHLRFRPVTRAIYQAIEKKAHVISMSLGGPFKSKGLEMAVNEAVKAGIIVVAAAGNKWPRVVYPAKLPRVIAVAASNCLMRPWSSSARGSQVDMAAPGESVWRAKTFKGSKFDSSRSNGTSYATAMTAGAAALWLAFHGRAKLISRYGKSNLNEAFRQVLKTKGVVKPAGWKTSKFGAGILDVEGLLKAPLPVSSTLPPAPKSPTAMAEIVDYFPGAKSPKVRVVLAKMFGVTPPQLAKEMKVWGDELRLHLATNPELQHQLQRRMTAATPTGISAATLGKPELLGRTASPGLKERLGIH